TQRSSHGARKHLGCVCGFGGPPQSMPGYRDLHGGGPSAPPDHDVEWKQKPYVGAKHHAAPSSTISPSNVGCSDSGCGSVCICASSTRASIKSRAPFTSCAGNDAASVHRARSSSVSVVCSTRARNESTSTTAGCSTAAASWSMPDCGRSGCCGWLDWTRCDDT